MSKRENMTDSQTLPTTPRRLAVSLPADRTNLCVGADTYSIVIKGSDTDEKLAFIDMLIPPGGGPMPTSARKPSMWWREKWPSFARMSARLRHLERQSMFQVGRRTAL